MIMYSARRTPINRLYDIKEFMKFLAIFALFTLTAAASVQNNSQVRTMTFCPDLDRSDFSNPARVHLRNVSNTNVWDMHCFIDKDWLGFDGSAILTGDQPWKSSQRILITSKYECVLLATFIERNSASGVALTFKKTGNNEVLSSYKKGNHDCENGERIIE